MKHYIVIVLLLMYHDDITIRGNLFTAKEQYFAM